MKIPQFFLVSLVVSMTGVRTGMAYVGNTPKELVKWYGEPAESRNLYRTEWMTTRLYHFNGLNIMVNLVDGRSWSEFYRKADGSVFTKTEIEKIVLANTGLEPPAFNLDKGIWNFPLGSVSISYDPLHRALYLASYEQSKTTDSGTTMIVSGRHAEDRKVVGRNLQAIRLPGRENICLLGVCPF